MSGNENMLDEVIDEYDSEHIDDDVIDDQNPIDPNEEFEQDPNIEESNQIGNLEKDGESIGEEYIKVSISSDSDNGNEEENNGNINNDNNEITTPNENSNQAAPKKTQFSQAISNQQNNNDDEDEYKHSYSENEAKDENVLWDRFNEFMEEKKPKCVLHLDESRVNLLPAQLRTPIQIIITKIKRWAARNPTGAPLSALQILAERLDEFLELQERRNERDYENRCKDLLSIIYRNTIEAQRLSQQLREQATPKGLDEYE